MFSYSFCPRPMSTLSSWVLLALLLSSCSARIAERTRQYSEVQKYGLVFRLHDYKQRYDFYEKNGLHDRAVKERAENDAYNRALMTHFKQYFDFCEMRFFYASQIKELQAGKPVLLNAQLQPDPSIPLPEHIIVASYDYGDVDDHSAPLRSFSVEKSQIKVRHSSFFKWLKGSPADSSTIKKINKRMWKQSGLAYTKQ